MRTVFKYDVPVEDNPLVRMPKGAELLSVGVQDDAPRMWALVDPKAPLVYRRLRVAGTGHPIEAEGRFVGTAILLGGRLVLHVFDCGEGQ